MIMVVPKVDSSTDQIVVFFPEDAKVGVKPIKKYNLILIFIFNLSAIVNN